MNVENIPTYLKKDASWRNFRYEERKGNMTKVPYNPAPEKITALCCRLSRDDEL